MTASRGHNGSLLGAKQAQGMALSPEDTGEDRGGSGRAKTEAGGRYREEKDGADGVV